MSYSTINLTTTFGHIDPGPEPESEEGAQDTDVEMTGEYDDEDSDLDVMRDDELVSNVGPPDDIGDTGPDQDDMAVHDPTSNMREDRLIVAIDFGTTFSSVAYTVIPRGVSAEEIDLRQVKCIGSYPGYEPPSGFLDYRYDVPTELWYDDGGILEQRRAEASGADDGLGGDAASEHEESSSGDDDVSDEDDSPLEDESGSEEHKEQREIPHIKLTTQYWGYQVQQKLNISNIPRDEARPLSRFKLFLDQKRETDDVRSEVRMILRTLIQRRIIRKDTDMYTDFLTHLLRHTKEQLCFTNELQPDMLVQFVLCVPAKWPVKACRTMQSSLEEALVAAGFSGLADGCIENVFMISEPEAAAECILAEAKSELFHNETIVIVDAGGGTVDAVTYQCEHGDPLRLSAEVVAPDSRLCGGSYINERFEQKLLQKLAKETYLIKNGKTLKSIAQAKTSVFENGQKRTYDISRRNAPPTSINIDDLRENRKKRFHENWVEFKRKTMKGFFEPSLLGVKSVLENQLELAESQGKRVQKVILTGGFGQSPSLQSYLRVYLEGRRNIKNWEVDLIVPGNPSTAVARGAVLRALNKKLGPDRITQCSYGFVVSEPYDPVMIPAHQQTRCRINKVNGEKYVDGTLRWVIQAGVKVKNMQEFCFRVVQVFPLTKKRLVCREELWMSDSPHQDHYRKTHSLNKRAELIGSIEADLTFLRDEGLIKPRLPDLEDNRASARKPYWEPQYEVALIVEGRSIRFEARWPVKEELAPGKKQRVLAMKLVGIAAAFKPGTA